jgi:hypothetical protein
VTDLAGRLMLALDAAGQTGLLSWSEIEYIQTLVEQSEEATANRVWTIYQALGEKPRTKAVA